MIYLNSDLFKAAPSNTGKTILILGDSQTQGAMGRNLENRYKKLGFNIVRFGVAGKGAKYFNQAITKPRTSKQRKIYNAIKSNPDHIIISSLGGNDWGASSAGATKLYNTFFKNLKSLNVPITFNGSPSASTHTSKLRVRDKRRASIDNIQKQIAKNYGITFNSVRGMGGTVDSDGIHRNKMGVEYADYLTKLNGMPSGVSGGKISTVKTTTLPPALPHNPKYKGYADTTAPLRTAAPTTPKVSQGPTFERFRNQPPKGSNIPEEVDNLIMKYSKIHGVDPNLARGAVRVESNFKPKAHNKKFGASGYMQLLPSTFRDMGEDPKNIYDPEANIRAGIKYLGILQRKGKRDGYSDPTTYALAAYSHGPGTVGKLANKHGKDIATWPKIAKVQSYPKAVLKFRDRYAKMYPAGSAAKSEPYTSRDPNQKIRFVRPESFKRSEERFVRVGDGKPILLQRPEPYTPRDPTTGVERRPTRVAGTSRRATKDKTYTASSKPVDEGPYPITKRFNFSVKEAMPEGLIEVELDKPKSPRTIRGSELGSKLKRRAPEQAKVDRWRYKSPGEAIAAKQRGASLVGTAYEKHPAVLRAPDKPTFESPGTLKVDRWKQKKISSEPSGAPGTLKVDRWKQKKISSEPSGAPGTLKTDNFKYKSKGQRLAAAQKVQPTVDRWKYKSPGQAAAAAKTRGADLTGTAYEKSPSVSQFRSSTPPKKAVAKPLPASNNVAKSVEAFMPISKNKAGV